MIYAAPGTPGAVVTFKPRYGNYIGGEFVPPVKGQYFTNTSPVNGQPIAEFPRSTAEDIDKALDAAHAAADAWGRTSVQERSNILLKIADRIEQNLELLAVTETWDNGKAVRETLNADIPLAADHFRYFAGCIRAQEGSAAEINDSTVAYHIHEPLGKEWRDTNPYREPYAKHDLAVEIGASAYNQNCARCHGLEAKSGGIAPDLRLLETG
ncbi:aldehyde dehydrogenase family protein, partial [Pseudomonas aeruginosa]|uniref:aldehyde dehydrogenase family protein n=1 Tax=Pseudomonas aeruginosa TaxID=287 RepID=UPI0021AE4183